MMYVVTIQLQVEMDEHTSEGVITGIAFTSGLKDAPSMNESHTPAEYSIVERIMLATHALKGVKV